MINMLIFWFLPTIAVYQNVDVDFFKIVGNAIPSQLVFSILFPS